MLLFKKVGWFCCLLAPLMLQAEPAMPAAADLPQADAVKSVPRIATVDWTIAETLLALGVTPLAVGMSAPTAPGSANRCCRPPWWISASVPSPTASCWPSSNPIASSSRRWRPAGADPLPHRAGTIHRALRAGCRSVAATARGDPDHSRAGEQNRRGRATAGQTGPGSGADAGSVACGSAAPLGGAVHR